MPANMFSSIPTRPEGRRPDPPIPADVFSRDDLQLLLREEGFPLLSLYLPTHRRWIGAEQGPLRLKGLLRRAEEALAVEKVPPAGVDRLLEPARIFLGEKLFWRRQAQGLALFITDKCMRFWRLPVSVPEKAVVGPRFHIRPLLPLFVNDGSFWLLALDLGRARLFEASRHSMREVDLPGAPSLGETRVDGGFHGREGADPRRHQPKAVLSFEALNEAVNRRIAAGHAPLVLGGAAPLHALYRRVNTYPRLWPEGVETVGEMTSPEDLRRRAWSAVESHFGEAEGAAWERYLRLAGTGQASDDIREIVPAAHHRRVDALFVATDAADQWGRCGAEDAAAVLAGPLRPGSEDLLDLAASLTFRHGGTVFSVPPDRIAGGCVVAVFRY